MANNTDMFLRKLDTARMLRRQAAKLITEKDMEKAMGQVLEAAGDCAGAERVYVFEERIGYPPNLYEWCAPGIASGRGKLEKVTGEDLAVLTDFFDENESLILRDIEMIKSSMPRIYDIFAGLGSRCVIAAPVEAGDKLTGFIAADIAPGETLTEEMTEMVNEMLLTLGSFIGITMNNNREQERLLTEYGHLLKSYEVIRNTNDVRNTLVEAVGSGIFAYTLPDREILLLNSEAKRLFDCPEDEEGYDFIAMMQNKILSEDSESMRKATRTLKEPGDHAEYLFHIRKDSGEQLSVRCHSQLRAFSNGQRYILSAMTDVTEQEKLERSLAEERGQYRDALDMNSYFSFAIDLTDGYFYEPVIAHDGREIIGESRYEFPLAYDEFMRESFDRLNMAFLIRKSEKLLHREELIELFYSGVTHFDGECYAVGIGKYYQVMVLLSELKENGHINANVVVNDITERTLEEEKNRSIIDSLSSIYHCVYFCDLEEAACEVIKMQDNEEDRLPYDGTVQDFVRVYVSEYIVPEFVGEVREFLDMDTIDRRFADTDALTIEYRRRNIGWCRGALIVTERREDRSVARLVFAVSIIEEQKKKELQAIHEIKRQWLITKSFSEIYFASWIVDLKQGRVTEVTVPEFARGIARAQDGEVHAAFQYLLDQFVVEEYKTSMEEFLDLDTLGGRIAGRESISKEYQGRVNGWCRANFIPVDDGSDRLIFAVQVIDEEKKKEIEIDMALRQAFETARSANRAKTTFFANMSHDMRTPLNVIVGMTAVANAHLDDSTRVKDCLDKISISGNHLLRMINEVLDMSKIEAGQIELHEEEFALRELVEELLVLTKSQVEEKHHEFSIFFQNIKHGRVLGDYQRIQQVFLNILTNAVKYTPDGGAITLSVCETPMPEDNVGQFEFVFQDNGIGMSEEFMEHLFDPFERAEDRRVQKTPGTGLGMPIAKHIVQMMNGTISVESKLGEGTKFTVLLRLKVVEQEASGDGGADKTAEAAEEASALPYQEMSASGNRRLLVAEDYDMNWEVLEMLLPDYGFDVERAENGQICVDKFAAAPVGFYDAILMDVRMPIKNGYEATIDIRKCGREDADLPIIAMTADAFVEDVQACKDAGMNEHISKPLDIRKLLEVLKNYLP